MFVNPTPGYILSFQTEWLPLSTKMDNRLLSLQEAMNSILVKRCQYPCAPLAGTLLQWSW